MSGQSSPHNVVPAISRHLEALQAFNAILRQNLEAAELLIPQINDAIGQLVPIQVVHQTLLTAGVVWRDLYEQGHGPSDSALLYVAALKVRKGIGAFALDMNALLDLEREKPSEVTYPTANFLPFGECPSCVKASVLSRVPALLQEFFTQTGIQLS